MAIILAITHEKASLISIGKEKMVHWTITRSFVFKLVKKQSLMDCRLSFLILRGKEKTVRYGLFFYLRPYFIPFYLLS
ncbi:TPA: hypothetical protein ACGPAX_002077, partial [Streptococcus suis]